MPEAAITTRSQDSGAEPDHTRLHITPFDADLLSFVLPASIRPNARNISYHTVQTGHDKRFGFVDLPTEDAERIRKKLNGSVLKGAKMRIEKARPETWQDELAGKEMVPDKKRKKTKDEGKEDKKKRKKDHNLVEGVELQDGRKVKRGWTVSNEDKIKEKRKSKKERDQEKSDAKDKKKEKKREERSKYTDKEECLLKTKLPGGPAQADGDDSDRKKRKKGKARETVVHEFANTTKFPTFLRANKASGTDSGATEFVEGKGWVDAEGNLVEEVKSKPVRKSKPAPKKTTPAPQPEDDTSSESSSEDEEPSKPAPPAAKSVSVVAPADDTTSSSGSSSEDEGDSERGTAEPPNTAIATPAKSILKSRPPPVAEDDDATSSSGSSSEDSDADSDDEKPSQVAIIAPSPVDALKNDARPKSSSSNVSLTIKIPPPPPMTPGKVHPLEALYKRNQEAAAAGDDEAQPFSFFGGNDDIDEDESAAGATTQVPMTPFTQRDFEWRNVRSAAPTPDTAHPSKVKNFWAIGSEGADEEMVDDDMDLNDVGGAEGESSAAGEASGPGGEFQKWFWENRRDLNRSWMQRRKTAAKEKRHRDNKSRAAKAV